MLLLLFAAVADAVAAAAVAVAVVVTVAVAVAVVVAVAVAIAMYICTYIHAYCTFDGFENNFCIWLNFKISFQIRRVDSIMCHIDTVFKNDCSYSTVFKIIFDIRRHFANQFSKRLRVIAYPF